VLRVSALHAHSISVLQRLLNAETSLPTSSPPHQLIREATPGPTRQHGSTLADKSTNAPHRAAVQHGVILQPFSHPRIPEIIFASTADGRGPISPASNGYTTTHAQRPADIHPGVQLDTCEEGAAARLLGTRARVTQYHHSCNTPVPYP
jgi:hypothetical protein